MVGHSASRLLSFALTTLVAPAGLLVLLRQYSFSPGLLECIGLYVALVATRIGVALSWKQYQYARRAKALGAVVLPKAQGNWPGNVDIMVNFIRRFSRETLGLYWDEIADELKSDSFNMNVLGGDVIFTRDPAFIKAILTSTEPQTHALVFEKGPWLDGVLGDLLGKGVFNSDGLQWKAHRALARPFFAKERISDFDTFAKHSDHLLEVIRRLKSAPGSSLSHQDGAIEIQDLFGRFTLDAAIQFLMGGTLSSLSDVPQVDPDSTESNRFLNAFNKAQENVFHRSRLGDLWPLFEPFKSKNEEPMKVIGTFVDHVVQNALDKSRTVQDGEEYETLLDHLIQETRDPRVLKDQVLNILLAARDTTQSTLTSAVYVLARNPDIMARLRSEILSAVGKDANPTYQDARDIKYLRAFLNEILRLYSPVPFNVRAATRDTVVVASNGTPYFVPKGCRMSFAILNTQRREELWGPDAKRFDPERWLDDRMSYYKSNLFAFTPFSAGPRLCLGQQFAYNEASFAIIKLLQAFDSFELAMDVQPKETHHRAAHETTDGVLLQTQITLFFKGGLWVRLNEAQK